MVDLSEIQAAYYMVAATGVLVAAVYYTLNMRETAKNRRATFANTMLQSTLTEEWNLRHIEVMNMHWNDFEDFKRKYDSSVDPQIYAKRLSIWASDDRIGVCTDRVRSALMRLVVQLGWGWCCFG
ncbi:MAG: hypothetical protein ABSA11_16530 [Candidatus Bathyarchaeia archaeon]